MKNLTLLSILLFLLCSTSTYARKSPIVNVEIANTLADFYLKRTSALFFKFTREDGTIDHNRGYKDGRVSWNKLHVKSPQASLYNGFITVNYKALKKNDYTIDIEVYVGQGARSFIKTIRYKLPRITQIEIVQDSITPYTWYNRVVNVHSIEKIYTIKHGEHKGLFNYTDFYWKVDPLCEVKNNLYRYTPNIKHTYPKTLRIQVVNETLGLQDVRDIPITTLKQKELTINAIAGQNGKDGENGEDGSTGEHGGSGGGGWHAADGNDGEQVEIIIARHTDKLLKAIIFENDQRQVLYLPYNSKITIRVNGGNGGNGGRGGNGGDGGSSSDEYEAGDDGSGGPGGNGGDGGTGGNVLIFSDLDLQMLSLIVDVKTPGGLPGKGGRGGYGSPSGTGGKMGKQGKEGTTTYQILSKEDIAQMMKELGL